MILVFKLGVTFAILSFIFLGLVALLGELEDELSLQEETLTKIGNTLVIGLIVSAIITVLLVVLWVFLLVWGL